MVQLLKKYLKCSEKQLFSLLEKELKEHYPEVKKGPDNTFLYAPGKINILLVAHLDVVYIDNRCYIEIFYDPVDKVMWSPSGLGADDRAGVAMIMFMLQYTDYRPSILFTTGEETNLKGALTASKLLDISPNFIIELDRQGGGESVYYNCDNKEFEKYINSFGFETRKGSYTDISVLCPVWHCAGVNLSVGYFDEHSYSEHLRLNSFFYTYDRLLEMLEEPLWAFAYIPKEEAVNEFKM